MNTMMVTIGNYTFTAEALRGAEWERNEDLCAGWTTDYENVIRIWRDETAWCSIDATVADTDGETYNISIVRTEGDEAMVYIDHEEESSIEIDDEWASVYELEELIGKFVKQNFDPDTYAIANDILLEHADAIYVLYRCRGFANEWTLYICASEKEAEAIEEHSNTERLDSDEVIDYLSDALMTDNQYKYEYGVESYVCAVLV